MAKIRIFISYSHKDTKYFNELVSALQTVQTIKKDLWFDVQEIEISDKFHEKIQAALPESRIAILLLSNHFFNSSYISRDELPFLVAEADKRGVKLAPLYVTKMAKAALKRTVELLGEQRSVALSAYIGANGPDNPLDLLKSEGQRNEVYAKLADWVAEQLEDHANLIRRYPDQGKRYELAVRVKLQGEHWQHSYALDNAPDLGNKPDLDFPSPDLLSYGDVTEDELFELLFGHDQKKNGELFGAAFEAGAFANPTSRPLRVRLLTDDDRLVKLRWTDTAYGGRTLHDDGWTVELHPDCQSGFPEYPSHTCLFPAKIILVASRDTARMAHFRDLQGFFQRTWPKSPCPAVVHSGDELRAELRAGSTRLLYYCGSATKDGLLLEGAESSGRYFPWTELRELLAQTRSVSLVLLNLLGESSRAAVPMGRDLVGEGGARAVLFQCNERDNAAKAAKAGLAILRETLAGDQLDPVVALHRYHCGLATAWTRYSSWRLVAPKHLEHPDLVGLLLDRRSQRAELGLAKKEFDRYQARRIYHAVAFGAEGCRVNAFPATASQHLKLYEREDRDVIIQYDFALKPSMTTVKHIDDAVRQRLRLGPRTSIIRALIEEETTTGSDFWFLVLGWTLPGPVRDADTMQQLINAVADWCHGPLSDDIAALGRDINVRVISVMALETPFDEEDIVEIVEDTVADLGDRYDDEDVFHIGKLDRLAGVTRDDLSHYFKDTQICRCDERYRKDFPKRLLAGRREMPFDEAVTTIQRGDDDNWGNLYEELDVMREVGTWPPADYDPHFWEAIDDH